MSRTFTIKFLEMMEEGLIEASDLATIALNYMSEEDVKDLYLSSFSDEDSDEDED